MRGPGRGRRRGTLLGPEGTAACGGCFLGPFPWLPAWCRWRGGGRGRRSSTSAAGGAPLGGVLVVVLVGGAGGGPGRCLRTAQWTRASLFSVVEVCKGTGWMPWHQEPKKDVVACDMPRGVGKRTVIRGFPNGETPHQSCGATRI